MASSEDFKRILEFYNQKVKSNPISDSENEDGASTASPVLFSVTIRTSSGLSLQQYDKSFFL